MFKRIDAIIREEALDDVIDELRGIGIVGMSVVEIHGHGREGGISLSWRGTSYQMDMVPKIQLSVVLSERNLQGTVDAIISAARTGEPGDGIIFVSPVEDIIRVRTGERGKDALAYPGDIDEMRAKSTITAK